MKSRLRNRNTYLPNNQSWSPLHAVRGASQVSPNQIREERSAIFQVVSQQWCGAIPNGWISDTMRNCRVFITERNMYTSKVLQCTRTQVFINTVT